MGKTNSEISYAAVRRLANVIPGIIVERDAVKFVIADAEDYIQGLFKAAVPFMEHRKGKMIMKQDIEAYLRSIEPSR